MTDIFLSYTEKDRELARRFAAVLEAHGFSVWWDRRIPAGKTWRHVLEEALEKTRCMVVLWSSRSIESEWVYEEASEGRRLGKLFPVLLEAVRPPAGFREIQAADLAGWDGSAEFDGMRLLLADLENFLGKPSTRKPVSPALNKEPPARASGAENQADFRSASLAALPGPARTLQAWALAGVVLIVAGSAYFALRPPPAPVLPPASPAATVSLPPLAPPAPAQLPLTPGEKPHARNERQAATDANKSNEANEANEAKEATEATEATAPTARETARVARSATGASRPRTSRCADWLARMQLGETLSTEAQNAYRKECR